MSTSTQMAKESTELADLAAEINAEHDAAMHKATEAIEHARTCGELLTKAKEKLKHGAWTPWLEENCTVSPRQTQKYMRLYSNWHVIEEAKANSDSHLTMTIENSLFLVADRELMNKRREAKRLANEEHSKSGFIRPSMRPVDTDRILKIERNEAERGWSVAWGPNALGMRSRELLDEELKV